MTTRQRTFDDHTQKIVTPSLTFGAREQTLVGLVGSWSCADVWVACPKNATAVLGGPPPSAWPTSTFRLYGINGKSRTLLDMARPIDRPSVQTQNGRSGIVLEARGRPCDSFEVTATPTAPAIEGAPPLPTRAEIVLEVWGNDAERPLPHDLVLRAASLPLSDSSTALEGSHVFAAAPALVSRVSVLYTGVAAVIFAQLLNADGTVAIAGMVPVDAKSLPGDPAGNPGRLAEWVFPRGKRFSKGLIACVSSTADTVTELDSAFFSADWDLIP